MEREQLVGAGFGFGDERRCVCAGGVGQRPVCGGQLSRRRAAARPITLPNGTGAVGRRWVRGWTAHVCALAVSGSDLYAGAGSRRRAAARPITSPNGTGAVGRRWVRDERQCACALAVSGSDLYAGGCFTTAGGSAANHIAKWDGSSWSALGSGMERGSCVCAGGVGQRPVCGGRFHDGGRQRGQHIAKWNGSSWSALGSGMNGGSAVLRWRCRAATCMRGAISRRRAAARPITLPNGTGAVGRRWVRGWDGDSSTVCMRWRCRAATCMRGAISRRRAAVRPITSPNGTGAVGRRWVRG